MLISKIPKNSGIFICVIVVVYLVQFAGQVIDRNKFDDDRIYLYSTNFLICEQEAWEQSSTNIIRYMERNEYQNQTISVFNFRYKYSDNYFLYSATICLAKSLIPQNVGDLDYGIWLYAALHVGLGLGHLVCLLIVFAVLWRTRGTDIPVIVLMTIVLMVVMGEYLPTPKWRLTNTPSWIVPIITTLFIAHPGFEFTLFGITPRHASILLLVAVTVLRWRGQHTAGYWVIVVSTLTHGTYGALTLVICASLDIILKPEVLRNWRNIIPAFLVFTPAVLRMNSFDSFGGTWIGLWVVALAVAVFSAIASPVGERLLAKVPPVAWLRNMQSVRAETLLLLLGMVFSVVLAKGLAMTTSGLTVKYVAHELSGRPISLMRIPFLLGLVAISMRMATPRFAPVLHFIALVAAVLIIVLRLEAAIPTEEPWFTGAELELEINESLSNPSAPYPEHQIYYALSCQLDGRCDTLDRMLAPAANVR